MKNRADNIIDLLNILRVTNDKDAKLIEKDDFFLYKNYVDEIRFNDNKKEEFIRQTYGYFSVLKNTNKISFA
jgi:hypothetical protein